jgi:hypothetical protein
MEGQNEQTNDDLIPSVNLIGHAAITEMIKLQFTTITDRIRNKIRNGNWFPKFSINRKEQKFLPSQTINKLSMHVCKNTFQGRYILKHHNYVL